MTNTVFSPISVTPNLPFLLKFLFIKPFTCFIWSLPFFQEEESEEARFKQLQEALNSDPNDPSHHFNLVSSRFLIRLLFFTLGIFFSQSLHLLSVSNCSVPLRNFCSKVCFCIFCSTAKNVFLFFIFYYFLGIDLLSSKVTENAFTSENFSMGGWKIVLPWETF